MTAMVVFVTACVSLIYLSERGTRALDKEMKNSLRDISESAALLVNGDIHGKFTNRAMEGTAAYQNEVVKFRKVIEKVSRLAYIYTVVLKDDKVHFVLDSALPGDADGDGVDDHSYIMDVYDTPTDEMLTALKDGVTTVDQEPYTDKWGTFISGYVPVRDSAQKVVGVLGVDVRVQDVMDGLASIRRAALISAGFAFIISLLLGAGVWMLRSRTLAAQREAVDAFRAREQAESRYRQLFEQTPIGVVNYGTDLHITDCNQQLVDIIGTSRDRLVGMNMADLRDKSPLKCIHDALDGKPGFFLGQYRTTTSDRNIWIEINTGPIRDANGAIIGGIGTIEDISTRHRSEMMSEAEKKMLSMITQAAPLNEVLLHLVEAMEVLMSGSICSVLFLDEEGRHLLRGVSRSLPEEYNNSLHGLEIGPETGSCGSAAYFGRAVVVSDIQTDPLWRTYRDLAARYDLRSCWSMPIKSARGKVLGTFAIYHREPYKPSADEIALLERASYLAGIAFERSRYEQELSRERHLLRTLIENLPDVIFIKDKHHQYLVANKTAARYLGVENEDQLIGHSDFDFFPTSTAAISHNIEERVLAGASDVNHESTIVKPDGETTVISFSRMPLKSDSGDTIGLVVIGRNVTAQRSVEEERIRTQKLESLGLLAGGIAHDFNNILTSILGNVSLIKSSPDGTQPENIELLAEAESAIMRASELTQQLLTFAKGGLPVKKPTDIVKVVKDAAGFAVRGSASRLVMEIAPDMWVADIDSGQISQVVQNLVMNADQAMPGGGTITISGGNVSLDGGNRFNLPAGHYVQLSVKDHGVGIPDNIIDKVFDPYFTTKQSGNGLGLTTSFSIVKKHGGSIFVNSKTGAGSDFSFILPALPDVVVKVDAPGGKATENVNARILLMDDEDAILKLCSRMLVRAGYPVSIAHHGHEAINLFKEAISQGAPFNLVVLDLTIPGGMGGKETFDRLREIDPNIRAIVSSGYSMDEIMARYESFGFSGVVTKPYHRDDLINAINAALSQAPA
jgi:PAS domain S-box-containing protein